MRKHTSVFCLLFFLLAACGNKNTGTGVAPAGHEKTDPAPLQVYPALALPFTTSFNATNHQPVLIDSVKANELLLKQKPGCREWAIVGRLQTKNWLGIVYDVSVTDDFERLLTLYDLQGNKRSETILISNESECFGPDRDCQVEVTITENKIEVLEFFTRYTRDAVETPIEHLETLIVYSIDAGGKVKQVSKKNSDLSHAPAISSESEDLSNKTVVWKNALGHEIRLEIMGRNHETLWYYSEGDGEIQIIPMIGENDYYALQNNHGENIGFMQLNKINEADEFRIAGEIELSINGGEKSVFKQSKIVD